MRTEAERQLAGVVGFYNDSHSLMDATVKVRDANYRSFDTFTPYPVHGLEQAQGLKRSPLPWVTFFAGLTGLACAFALQYWTSAVDWPINIGGKPLNSWPAFVPVMFELTILFAGLSTVGAMFFLNGLPNMKKKAFDSSITRDRFAIMIDVPETPSSEAIEEMDDHELAKFKSESARFKAFDEREAAEFLKKSGATEVRSVYAEGWF